MPLYQYMVRDEKGKRVTGNEEAPSQDILFDRLTKKGYVVTKLEPLTGKAAVLEPTVGELFSFGRISDNQLIFFNMQLSNMVEAGVPLLASLTNIIAQVKNRRFRRVLQAVARDIEAGKSFSEAASKHPKVFSDLFVNLVLVGETSGTLDVILTRYALLLEDQLELKQKVRSAMTYPIILIIVSLTVLVLMITLVVPNFVKIFSQSGVPLPAPTQLVYTLSLVFRKYWIAVLAGCFLMALMITFLRMRPWGKRFFDLVKLKAPPFSSLIRKVIISRWARTLGTLIGGGVPILQALAISRRVAQNIVIEEAIQDACSVVEKGGRIADAFKSHKEFPLEVDQMINVGEESGSVDRMLVKIADYYDKMIAYQVKRLSDLIEPLFLILIGGLVAFIMISVLLPIFDMIRAVQARGF